MPINTKSMDDLKTCYKSNKNLEIKFNKIKNSDIQGFVTSMLQVDAFKRIHLNQINSFFIDYKLSMDESVDFQNLPIKMGKENSIEFNETGNLGVLKILSCNVKLLNFRNSRFYSQIKEKSPVENCSFAKSFKITKKSICCAFKMPIINPQIGGKFIKHNPEEEMSNSKIKNKSFEQKRETMGKNKEILLCMKPVSNEIANFIISKTEVPQKDFFFRKKKKLSIKEKNLADSNCLFPRID